MLIAMAGLPGTGKSTLAQALTEALPAVVLDKDQVRAALFPPAVLDYSAAQNDHCMDVIYRTAAFLLQRRPEQHVIVDGRTFATRPQRIALREAASKMGAVLHVIECVCAEATALARLAHDAAMGSHPAADRDPALYRRVRARWEPISAPKRVIDTDASLETCVARCLDYLREV
jgi:adenylylsulfate kinase